MRRAEVKVLPVGDKYEYLGTMQGISTIQSSEARNGNHHSKNHAACWSKECPTEVQGNRIAHTNSGFV
jgi:hypothetical protein